MLESTPVNGSEHVQGLHLACEKLALSKWRCLLKKNCLNCSQDFLKTMPFGKEYCKEKNFQEVSN